MFTKKLFIPFFVICFFFCFNKNVQAQILMSSTGSNTENFDALINTGTSTWFDNSTIPNWYSQRTTVGVGITAGTGSSFSGGLFSFGSLASTERALGTVGSGNAIVGGGFAHGVQLKNTSGSNINNIKVSYTLEQWRNGGNQNIQPLHIYYKIATSAIAALNPPDTFTTPLIDINALNGWTKIPLLTLNTPINTSPAATLDGNAAANKVSVSNIAIPGLNLANNEFIMIKWDDSNHVNFDHGVGIDDVTISWSVAQTSATISPTGNISLCIGTSQTLTISGAATGATFQWKRDGIDIIGATNSIYTAAISGTYTCVLTEGTVVTTLGSVVLTIKPLPSVTVSASDNSICLGSSSVLTANGAVSYVWSPSTALSSTTTNPITANPSATTTYTVTGTGSNGCKNSASTTIIVNPNPATPPITATPTTICSGGSISFSTPAIAGQTFVGILEMAQQMEPEQV